MNNNFIDYEEVAKTASLLAARWTSAISDLCVDGDYKIDLMRHAINEKTSTYPLSKKNLYVTKDTRYDVIFLHGFLLNSVLKFSLSAPDPLFSLNLLGAGGTDELKDAFLNSCQWTTRTSKNNTDGEMYAVKFGTLNRMVDNYNKKVDVSDGAAIIEQLKNTMFDKDSFYVALNKFVQHQMQLVSGMQQTTQEIIDNLRPKTSVPKQKM